MSFGGLVLYRLLQSQEGWISAGGREVNRTAIGRNQRHARIFRMGFGLRGRRGSVSQVTVEDGMVEEFGGDPLLLEF